MFPDRAGFRCFVSPGRERQEDACHVPLRLVILLRVKTGNTPRKMIILKAASLHPSLGLNQQSLPADGFAKCGMYVDVIS